MAGFTLTSREGPYEIFRGRRLAAWLCLAVMMLFGAKDASAAAPPGIGASGEQKYYTQGQCLEVCFVYRDWAAHDKDYQAKTQECFQWLDQAHDLEQQKVKLAAQRDPKSQALALQQQQALTSYSQCVDRALVPATRQEIFSYFTCLSDHPGDPAFCEYMRPNGVPKYPGGTNTVLSSGPNGYSWGPRDDELPGSLYPDGTYVYAPNGNRIGVWKNGKLVPN